MRIAIHTLLVTTALASGCRIGFDSNPADETTASDAAPDDTAPVLDSPTTPAKISALRRATQVEVGGSVNRLLINGSIMYAATTRPTTQLVVFDISSGTPIEIGQAITAGAARNLAIAGQRLYVTTATGGDDLEVFDISNPAIPSKILGIPAADTANGVAVNNGRAYVTSNSLGDDLEIFDVGDPTSITKLGGLNLVNVQYVNALQFNGNQLYVAGQRFAAVDVAVPSAPRPLSDFGFYWYARDLQVVGNRAYALEDNNNNSDQLRIFDLSNALAPVQIGAGRLYDSYGRGIAIAGRYAFTVCAPQTNAGGEIEVFDVSGTGVPPLVARASLGTDGLAIAVQGTRAFVGLANNSGPEIVVFDILP